MKRSAIVTAVTLIAGVLVILAYFGIKPTKDEPITEVERISVSTAEHSGGATVGKLEENINVTSYNQSGGITAGKVTVNEIRKIKNITHEKSKRGDSYLTTIRLEQTSGIWDSSTRFRIQVKLSGPYKTYRFTKGLPDPPPMRTTRNSKQNGLIDYEPHTPPLDGEIVLEIEAATDVDVEQIYVEPFVDKETSNQ